MKKTAYGMYRGRPEPNPGKMQFRYKGAFRTENGARDVQARLKAQGLRTKVVHYTGVQHYPWALYVVAKHEFWKRDFILGN